MKSIVEILEEIIKNEEKEVQTLRELRDALLLILELEEELAKQLN